ncbi:hypothetical protein K8I31_14015, partial [bacterium]|nr:hypothetical protein [bacterium]
METDAINPQVTKYPTQEDIAQKNAAYEEKQLKMYDRIAIALTVLYFFTLFLFYQPISNGPDSNGYYIQARLLVDTGKPWFERESLMQYTSPHWLEYKDKGIIASRYPPGMALVLALPYIIGGTYAMPLMNFVFTALSALGLYLVAKKWIGPLWGLFAMVAIMTNPV